MKLTLSPVGPEQTTETHITTNADFLTAVFRGLMPGERPMVVSVPGIALYEIEQDRGMAYVVTRWNLSRELSSLDAAEDWLNHVTGART